MDELITNFRWNRPLILRTFGWEDGERIMKTPISLAGKTDSNFWIHNSTGQYTVKSGYEVMLTEEKNQRRRMNSEEGSSATSRKDNTWKQLWKLNTNINRKSSSGNIVCFASERKYL